MKQLFFMICAVIAISLTSCSSSTNKFEGAWQPVKGSRVDQVKRSWLMSIEKVDKRNFKLLFPGEDAHDTIKLTYNEKSDQFGGYFKGGYNKIVYLKDKGHLLIPPMEGEKLSFPVEYEPMDKDSLVNR